jgi:hypothetical protein
MAQYTHCAEFSDWDSHWGGQGPIVPLLINSLKQALITAFLGATAGGAIGSLGGGIGALIGVAVGGYVGFSYGFVDGFCDQWLNWRLICVKRDQCAIGHVAWIETMSNKFGDDPIDWLFDNDLSFNLRLLPYTQGEFPREGPAKPHGLSAIESDGFPAAELLKKPPFDLDYKGYSGTDRPDHPGGRWTLHSEIEGDGMQTLCTIAKVLAVLGPLTAAAGVVAGAIVVGVEAASKAYNWVHDGCKKICGVPIFCDIACFVIAAAAAVVAGVIGAAVGAVLGAIPGMGAVFLGALASLPLRHNGEWSDVQNDPKSGNIEEEDCVVVLGDQVYDAGHSDGWLEIHPVRHLQKVTLTPPLRATTAPGFDSDAFRTEVKTTWDTWCDAVKKGNDPATKAAQDDPKNIWCLHPLVDGCRKHDEGPHNGGPHDGGPH